MGEDLVGELLEFHRVGNGSSAPSLLDDVLRKPIKAQRRTKSLAGRSFVSVGGTLTRPLSRFSLQILPISDLVVATGSRKFLFCTTCVELDNESVERVVHEKVEIRANTKEEEPQMLPDLWNEDR